MEKFRADPAMYIGKNGSLLPFLIFLLLILWYRISSENTIFIVIFYIKNINLLEEKLKINLWKYEKNKD